MAPVLDSLEHQYSGKEIVFISVSIDKNKSTWLKGIGKFSSVNSKQLYTNGAGTNDGIIRYYEISSYPSLVLIGKNGKLITARLPDPREKKGRENFEAMLNKAIAE